jgi:hypothetical protein
LVLLGEWRFRIPPGACLHRGLRLGPPAFAVVSSHFALNVLLLLHG